MKQRTKEHNKAISNALIGRNGGFKGKTHSLESKRKISESKSKRCNWDIVRKVRRDALHNIPRKIIAQRYNLTYRIVQDIILEKSWREHQPIVKKIKPNVDF